MAKEDYKKDFIASGKPAENAKEEWGIVRITIDLEKAEPHFYIKEGKKFLTFELRPKKKEDEWGRTHEGYVSTKKIEE